LFSVNADTAKLTAELLRVFAAGESPV